MTASRDPDRLIHQFLLEGEEQLHDQVYDVVRAEIEQKRQRAMFGPWRLPTMNKFVTIGLGAAAVVVLVFIGAQLFGSPSGGTGLGGEPTATAEPTATPAPSPSPPASAPPLTQSFTSTLHGYSVSYPEGWTAQAATEPWTDNTFPLFFGAPCRLPVRPGTDESSVPDHRLAADRRFHARGLGRRADGERRGMHGNRADRRGRRHRTDRGRDCDVAVVTTAGRGYWIQLYTSGDDHSPSLPTTGHGSRRSLPRCNCIPRTPSTEGRRASP